MSKFLLLAAFIFAGLAGLPSAVLAGAADYAFELVAPEIAKGDAVPVAVRLVNKKTGKPVPGAVIIRSRLDMAPDGMAEHTTSIKPEPASGDQPGIYPFKADLSMEGRWQLSLAAKVQGEAETVVGKLVIRVKK
jgi:hypothetical protein